MHIELTSFLGRRTTFASEAASWSWEEHPLPLEVQHYVSEELPLERFITSVRAVVFREDSVLVLTDRKGDRFIAPGGRRNPGESLEETARREVFEETGWTLGTLYLLGFSHFHLLSRPPSDYPYPHPDFVHLIYMGEALHHQLNRAVRDDWVVGSDLVPIERVKHLEMGEAQPLLLAQAVRLRGAV